MAKFDWYQATVDAPLPVLQGALQSLADGRPQWLPMQKAPHGYGAGLRLLDVDGPVLQVWHGGMHEKPHVVISGEVSQAGAHLLRGEFALRHTVSRADVCTDYADPGAYDVLQGLALGVARDCRIKVGTAGDHLLTKEGRTLYLGATSSHTRLRLYDKAAQLRDAHQAQPAKLAEIPAHLARLEFQVRPQTPAAKAAAAVADPVALMGSAAWTRELVLRVDGLQLEPFMAGRPWRQSDDDRAYAALLAQYGGLLKRIRQDLGAWDVVGLQLGQDLADRDSHAKRR